MNRNQFIPTAYRWLSSPNCWRPVLAGLLVVVLVGQTTVPLLAASRDTASEVRQSKPSKSGHRTGRQEAVKPGAAIVSIEPGRVLPGQTLELTIKSRKTRWVNGQTRVACGPEISVGGAPAGEFGLVQMVNKKQLVAKVTVWATASLLQFLVGFNTVL